MTQINFDRLWMQRFHEKLPEVYERKRGLGRRVVGFLTDADQPSVQNCGREFSPQEIVVNGDDVMHHRTSGDCRFGAMSLTTDDFDAAYKAVVGHEFPMDKLKRGVRPSPDIMLRLTGLHGTAGQMARSTPDVLKLPEASRALEQQLIHVMVRCLTEGVFSKIRASSHRQGTIIARLRNFWKRTPTRPCTSLRFARLPVHPNELSVSPAKNILEWAYSLSCLEENASCSPGPVAGRSIDDHCNKNCYRSRVLGIGAFRGHLSRLVWETPSATLQGPSDHRLMVSTAHRLSQARRLGKRQGVTHAPNVR